MFCFFISFIWYLKYSHSFSPTQSTSLFCLSFLLYNFFSLKKHQNYYEINFRSQKSLKQDVTRKPPLPKLPGMISPSCSHPPSQFPLHEEPSSPLLTVTYSKAASEERGCIMAADGHVTTMSSTSTENAGELPKLQVIGNFTSNHNHGPGSYHR